MEPRPKKARFFSSEEDFGPDTKSLIRGGASQKPPKPSSSSLNRPTPAPSTFRADLEAFLGPLSDRRFGLLLAKSKGNVEQAVNIHFDLPEETEAKEEPKDEVLFVSQKEKESPQTSEEPRKKHYIGSLVVTAWASKSSKGRVKYQDRLVVERQTHDHSKSIRKNPTDNSHVHIRTTSGELLGRISSEHDYSIASLIDSRVCDFDASCVYADHNLSLGSNFVVELKCYLTDEAFHDVAMPLEKKGKKRSDYVFDNSRESHEEKMLRNRQVAIVDLFGKLNLIKEDEANADMVKDMLRAKISSQTSSQPPPSQVSSDEESEPIPTDELDALYKRIEKEDVEQPETEVEGFPLDLRRYQKQGLSWMISREKPVEEVSEYFSQGKEDQGPINPLWTKVDFPDSQEKFYVNFSSGALSLKFPKQEKSFSGGILADEMGLGKTISTLAMVYRDRHVGCTLVVAPMSLLWQWEQECERVGVSAYVYHEKGADIDLDELFKAYNPNVLITSYHTLVSHYGQIKALGGGLERAIISETSSHERPKIFTKHFHRIVLDEAHVIKNRNTVSAKACCLLQATNKWALTGTPIHNRLEDLFSILKFLGAAPWNDFIYWRNFITLPFQEGKIVSALMTVQCILEPIVLRRTKNMKQADGSPLVVLPKKTINIEKVSLTDQERVIYTYVLARAQTSLQKSEAHETVGRNYLNILTQILRLRQSCCDPALILRPDAELPSDEQLQAEENESQLTSMIRRYEDDTQTSAGEYSSKIMARLQDQTAPPECPICAEDISKLAISKCLHMGCVHCLADNVRFQESKKQEPVCCICRQPAGLKDIFEVERTGKDGQDIRLRKLSDRPRSSKLVALVSKLKELPKGAKSVVFSQFTSYLDIIQTELRREKFQAFRFDGTLSRQQRTDVLKSFGQSDGSVLLISLKTGGVGLNLVTANYAFIMDPWWTFAQEAQAIDRIHRMGQTKDVFVTRFIVENSVEEKMLKIQQQKMVLAGTLGMSEQEQKAQRIENIKTLLGE
ncbi:DNA repair protein [Yarrowia sp. B02]|nr:DNA repair protein [Yarrowia sp. B02]